MHQNQLNTEQIQQLLNPLIISGIYKNQVSALNDIILEFIKNKLKAYKTIIEKLELKYNIDFNGFTIKIKNIASITEEDDWMDWKAALEMKEAWSKTLKSVMKNAN
ncbi:MAG: hypothetical protein JEY97_06505 [Bacteroidales bacterium]|nr:hypothetical protein [Bacteroidales bacterium]